jgi:hypothetical protein
VSFDRKIETYVLLAVLAAGCASNDPTGSAPSIGDDGSGRADGDRTGGAEMGGAGGASGGIMPLAGAAGSALPGAGGGIPSGGAAGNDGGEKLVGDGGTSQVATPDPCMLDGGCSPGTWVDVTPSQVNLTTGSCGNYGVESVQVDPARPQDLYSLVMCGGIWKSTNYGQTWSGQINTGTNGAAIGDCAGALRIAPGRTGAPPILYVSGIRGTGSGFWASVNGGVDFTHYNVGPAESQQFYPPAVDPNDAQHLLMAMHGTDLLVQSTDGGQTWKTASTDPGMAGGSTYGINFINTGDVATTRNTWLWMAAATGGKIGTWRTTNGGAAWTKVESNEHPAGVTEIYQPDTKGVVYAAGVYSTLGWGVLRSSDYGITWTHVGQAIQERVIIGTPKHLYSMMGGANGPGAIVDPSLEVADQPGTGAWTKPGTPTAMTQGPAEAVVTNDGTNNIIVAANYNAGLWRYIEPK